MNWSLAAFIAMVVLGIPLGWKALASGRGKPPPGEARYSAVMKGFGLMVVLLPGLGVGLLLNAMGAELKQGDLVVISSAVLGFMALESPLLIELFRVQHTFDALQLEYRTPWSRHRTLRWAEVKALEWNQGVKWLVLEDAQGARYRISPLLGGLEDLGRTALERLPPAVLQASPTGAAVLELMRRGKVFGLLMGQTTPEALLSGFPPERGSSSLTGR